MEIFPIEGQLGSLSGVAGPQARRAEPVFRVLRLRIQRAGLPHPVTLLRLEPINAEIAKHVKEVQVILDSRGLVWEFQMTDVDGERTVINFKNLKTDVGLKPEEVN